MGTIGRILRTAIVLRCAWRNRRIKQHGMTCFAQRSRTLPWVDRAEGGFYARI